LSDIAALRYGYKYEYKKYRNNRGFIQSNDYTLKVYFRYEDDSLIERLNFKGVTERFYAPDFKYIIGNVELSDLIANQDLLNNDGIFIAEIA